MLSKHFEFSFFYYYQLNDSIFTFSPLNQLKFNCWKYSSSRYLRSFSLQNAPNSAFSCSINSSFSNIWLEFHVLNSNYDIIIAYATDIQSVLADCGGIQSEIKFHDRWGILMQSSCSWLWDVWTNFVCTLSLLFV